ncbi:MAG TPA: XRE family transcriptional regulator [Candidatus Aquilonibacter sp.]|nr:XRE family transcriptional regulator [Candidatus Aquilonibacter sp.]
MEPHSSANGPRRFEVAFPGQPSRSSVPGPRDGRIELSPQAMRMLETAAPHKRPQEADPSGAAIPERQEHHDGRAEAVQPEVAEALIEGKRIGERIKFLRQRKHMGLVELGRHTGLSASFLSQLETGRVVPTLRNLARIAMVFSRDLSYFFEPERPELFRIMRAKDRARLPQTGAAEPSYFFESLGQVPVEQTITPYVAEFLPASHRHPPAAHQHPGAEFLYMLSGRLRLMHDTRTEILERGDAVYFDSSAKHSYECAGEGTCTALILTLPDGVRATQAPARMAPQPAAVSEAGMARRAR